MPIGTACQACQACQIRVIGMPFGVIFFSFETPSISNQWPKMAKKYSHKPLLTNLMIPATSMFMHILIKSKLGFLGYIPETKKPNPVRMCWRMCWKFKMDFPMSPDIGIADLWLDKMRRFGDGKQEYTLILVDPKDTPSTPIGQTVPLGIPYSIC